MARFHRSTTPAVQHTPDPTQSDAPELGPPESAPIADRPDVAPSSVPRTRTGAVWVAVCAATLIAVALIVFLVQNTRTVEISFLGMTTSTSLALALLIAAVGAALLTLILGTARITQLRRNLRKRPR